MANQAWQIAGPGQIELVDLGPDIPKPGQKQALIRMHAASFNYRDVLIVDHNPAYPLIAKPRLIPCSDGAGVVEDVGPESIWKKGDRVVIQPSTWLTGLDPRNFKLEGTIGGGDQDGTLRKFSVWDDARLIRAPRGMPLEEACTLWTAGVTAYRAFFYGPMKLGTETFVLTQGTGGVSCYAIQIAAAAGATVIATSSSEEKLQVAKALGAKHLINYRKTPNWAEEVLRITSGAGVDLVLDVVGPESIEETLKATRYGGAVVVVGMLSKDPAQKVNIMPEVLFGSKAILGQLGAGSRQMAEELATFMEKHQLHPQIAQIFGFEEADKGLEAATNLSAPGKVIVRI